jgi:hypothetical protein
MTTNTLGAISSRSGRGIVTIATGPQPFIKMAIDLGLSLRLHCDHIPRAVMTDSADAELAKLFDVVIPYQGSYGDDFYQKMWIDQYTPFAETLYIDCDSLVLRNLDFVWDLCRGREFAYVGRIRDKGRWYTDVPSLLGRLGLSWLGQLQGGMLYFRSGDIASRIFRRALDILDHYDDFGFDYLRGHRSDEPGLGIALGEEGIYPLEDFGRTMRTPCWIEGPLHIDVLDGFCEFVAEGERLRPAIMHFAPWKDSPTYHRERAKLRLYWRAKWLRPLLPLVGGLVYYRERIRELRRHGQLARTVGGRLLRIFQAPPARQAPSALPAAPRGGVTAE